MAILVVISLVLAIFSFGYTFETQNEKADLGTFILNKINAVRADHQNKPLRLNTKLTTQAEHCVEKLFEFASQDYQDFEMDIIAQNIPACISTPQKGLVAFSRSPIAKTDTGDQFALNTLTQWVTDGDTPSLWNDPGYTHLTAHFTQLLWASTLEVGCAVGEDVFIVSFDPYKAYKYFACYFNPPGNVQAGNSNMFYPDNIGSN